MFFGNQKAVDKDRNTIVISDFLILTNLDRATRLIEPRNGLGRFFSILPEPTCVVQPDSYAPKMTGHSMGSRPLMGSKPVDLTAVRVGIFDKPNI